jgi:alkanesulfonate monooxygenase SsuD/methylene tetrahydromethanopterin reductase-like flavin-dependent oxidoreductase (luciferase family)
MGMHLNAFTQCSPCPQSKGQWKHPLDRASVGYRDLDYWIELAKVLERGCFDALFFADIHGTYDVYKNSRDAAVRHGVQFPCYDPIVLIPALAQATTHLGFASTYSTTYHPPYQAAKIFSTLDHLSRGRVGWNVVTSYLRDAEKNGLGQTLPHDERYDRADEYMQVVYKLWEQSWEEDALVLDSAGDMHTDPSKVHEIQHKGKYFEDELERWVEEGGVDGFNLLAPTSPGSYVDFVVPELQRRGAFRTAYEGTTLREHYFGPGQQRLTDDHIGSSYRR